MTMMVTTVAAPLQVSRVEGKPSWAGSPGGPNGGGDDDGGDGGGDMSTTYVLDIEIDYMVGHEPTPEILAYIVSYYDARGITVTFYVDDSVPYDASVSDEEFWAIEAVYNDNDNDYFDNWKWVLFGTTVAGAPDVVGYCWVVTSSRNILAGNYIYIADATADDWATTLELAVGAEATVLMHEIGHSIGIGKLHPRFGERYDPDPGSVMSYLSESNAGLYDLWYYSDEYWATNNMEYYEEIIA
jgi:hypothetical protein